MTTNTSMTSDAHRSTDGDPDEIDGLTCNAKKIKREAEVTEESLTTLTPRETQYQSAKEGYTAASQTAESELHAARETLDAVLHELSCRLSEERRERLRRLWSEVREEIKQAQPRPGCQQDEDPFQEYLHVDGPSAALVGSIHEIRQRATDIDHYFQTLIDEQAQLPQRAAELKKGIDALVAEAGTDPGKQNVPKLYAQALVLEWRCHTVRHGFPTVQSYVGCVRVTFTNLLRAWRAIVFLEGIVAERACTEARAKERFEAMYKDPAAEVLRRYAKHGDDSGETSPYHPSRGHSPYQ